MIIYALKNKKNGIFLDSLSNEYDFLSIGPEYILIDPEYNINNIWTTTDIESLYKLINSKSINRIDSMLPQTPNKGELDLKNDYEIVIFED